MSKYTKPSLSIPKQIELLQSRGMVIKDFEKSVHFLQHNNYYRLRAYWYPFEVDHTTHQLKNDTTFETILNLYMFDFSLRQIVMEGLQMIEISVKTQWTYHCSQAFGTFGYGEPLHNRKMVWLEHNEQALIEAVERSDEVFISHFRRKYGEWHKLPPVWMASELMTFGLLSRWYKNLNTASVRQSIAGTYGVDNRMLDGLLEHLVYVRNLCAHHNRLWDREMVVRMPKVKNKPWNLSKNMNLTKPKELYNTLVMIAHFTDIIYSDDQWKQKLIMLITQSPFIEVERMGFPAEWQTLPIWSK